MNTKRKLLLGLASLAAIPLAATRRSQAAESGNSEIEALRKRIETLEAVDAIKKVQAKYLHLLFTQRFDRIVPECFSQEHPDEVSLEFSDSGIFRGLDRLTEVYAAFEKTKEVPGFFIMHMSTNPYIEIAADGKTAKSQWMSPGITGNANGGGWVFGPYYIDYVKENGEWRILHSNLAPVVRTDFYTSWADAEDNGTVRTIGLTPDGPPTIYRPYAEIQNQKDIFANNPPLPEPY